MKRAYGSEPILLHASPVTTTSPKRRLIHSRRFWILAATVLLLLVSATVVWIITRPTAPAIVPVAIARRAAFPVYQPTWLPEGFSVNPESFDAKQQVMTFAVKDVSVTRLVFTEQPKPTLEQISSFYSQQLSEVRTIPIKTGEVTIGQFEGMLIAAVATDKTWILIRAVATIEDTQLQKIAEHLMVVATD